MPPRRTRSVCWCFQPLSGGGSTLVTSLHVTLAPRRNVMPEESATTSGFRPIQKDSPATTMNNTGHGNWPLVKSRAVPTAPSTSWNTGIQIRKDSGRRITTASASRLLEISLPIPGIMPDGRHLGPNKQRPELPHSVRCVHTEKARNVSQNR